MINKSQELVHFILIEICFKISILDITYTWFEKNIFQEK